MAIWGIELTFTISQSPNSANLYLYPIGSTVSNFLKIGDTANYKCIDDLWYACDDDITYVYYDDVSTVSEHYILQNHTTETGTINYVRVIANAKSHPYAQSPNGKYVLKIYDGASTASGMNQTPLSTTYSKYYSTFATKPSGGAWTWDAVDNIQIKIACSSPSVSTTTNKIFRPNAAGTNTGLLPIGEASNYLCVDETTSDDDTTYVYYNLTASTRDKVDTYNIPDHAAGDTGTINYVTLTNVERKI